MFKIKVAHFCTIMVKGKSYILHIFSSPDCVLEYLFILIAKVIREIQKTDKSFCVAASCETVKGTRLKTGSIHCSFEYLKESLKVRIKIYIYFPLGLFPADLSLQKFSEFQKEIYLHFRQEAEYS